MKDFQHAPEGLERELDEIINEVRHEQEIQSAVPAKRGTAEARPQQSRQLGVSGEHRARYGSGRLIGVITVAACTALFLSLTAYTYFYPAIHPGLRAGTVSIGGMDQAAAAQAIDTGCAPLLADKTVNLSIHDKTYPIKIGAVTTGMDSHSTAEEAYAYTHEGSFFARLGHVLSATFARHEIPLSVAVDATKLNARLDEISNAALTEPVDPSWKVDGDQLIIDRGKPGVDFDREKVSQVVTERIRAMDFDPYKVPVQTEAQKEINLEEIKTAVDAEPENATVDKSDGKTVIDAVEGVQMDLSAAKKALAAADKNAQTVSVPVTRTPAAVDADTLRQVLFRDTLATAKTNFGSSNAARANNVRLAASLINGLILNPGEEFSYNNVVGERTTERGFRPAGAYVAGKLVDEVGGGVCQPSSTLYMAVLRANLKVTERTNHGFTVGYTPLGEDATVSYGSLDFRFKNSTDYPVKIVSDSSGGTLRMTIIGTKVTDQSVTTERKIVATYKPETIEEKDATLTVGTTKVKQAGQTGYKVETYKVITENGKTTRVKIGTSTYKKKDRIILVGTKPVQSSSEKNTKAAPEASTSAAGAAGAAAAQDPE